MRIFWTGDQDRPEGAVDYSSRELLDANKRLRRGTIVVGNPDAHYDDRLATPKGFWAEVHTEHSIKDIDHKFWSNSKIQKTTGLLSGFESKLATKMVATSQMNELPKGASALSVLIINGPNLNLVGMREPEIYGHQTLSEYFAQMQRRHPEVKGQIVQSNAEGNIIDAIQNARNNFDAIIINAGAYTHTSVAIHDALKSFDDIIIEVHISNPHQREDFRHRSFISPVAHGIVAGFGLLGYELAIMGAISKL